LLGTSEYLRDLEEGEEQLQEESLRREGGRQQNFISGEASNG